MIGSGVLSARYLRWAIEVIGADRLLSSTDYAWVDNGRGRAASFIDRADLPDDQTDAVASGNWLTFTNRRTTPN